MRILFAGGGSIGHIAPIVAVWRAIEREDPKAECRMLCSDRPEDLEFLRAERLRSTPIPILRPSLLLPARALRARRVVRELFDTFRPDVVFCKGGSVSIPAGLFAHRRHIPLVIHESDAVAGRATAFLSSKADVICTGFPHVQGLNQKNAACTGNPIRPQITQGKREEGLRITGLSGDRPVLLVSGGSQGSQALNDVTIRLLKHLLSLCDVVHLTGRGKEAAPAQEGYWSAPFVQDELPHLYAIATLALSRSGASNINELAANGIPALLVPLRGVAQDHQQANALAVAESDGCTMLDQTSLTQELLPTVHRLLGNRDELRTMSEHMRAFHVADAARTIASILLDQAHAGKTR